MQMLAGNKYVPPHMRNRPVPSSTEPVNRFANLKPKKTKNGIKKIKKVELIKPTNQIVEEIKIKPHCELFIADIPAPMRSVTTLAGFFHPYGEIANIQIIPVGQKFPEECGKFIDVAQFDNTFCAIVEFLTARVAKFVVGVLRKRIEALNFRIGLLKPGLAEEMSIQEGRLKESIYMPSYQINQTQEAMLIGTANCQSYSSEELSEVELNTTRNKRAILRITNTSDPAYWTGSSGISSGCSGSEIESDPDRAKRPISESSDDDDCDLLALALKNGIKVTRST
jgi:hypothetical protein